MRIFSFVKKVFVLGLTILSNITNALECISFKNQECKVRPEIVDINSNNPIFFPFSVKINKCSCNCNNINDPYARICIPDIKKKLDFKVFNLMSKTNETKNYFDKNGAQNYYVFQPLFKYLEVAHVGNITHILSWKSRGLHDTKLKQL